MTSKAQQARELSGTQAGAALKPLRSALLVANHADGRVYWPKSAFPTMTDAEQALKAAGFRNWGLSYTQYRARGGFQNLVEMIHQAGAVDRARVLEAAVDAAPAGPSDADVAEACRRLSAEMSTPQFAAALAACESTTDDQEVAMPTVTSPTTPDGSQASVVAIEAAANAATADKSGTPPTSTKRSRLAPAKPATEPDTKPAKRPQKTGATTTTQKPARTTTAKPAGDTKAGARRTPAQQAAAAAKTAATKRAKSVQALISAGKLERNAITEAVAKHGDLARAAKDAGVDVARVEAAIRPGASKKTGAKRGDLSEHAARLVAYFEATGTPTERIKNAADPRKTRYAVWLSGLTSDKLVVPKPERRDALRAVVAEQLGKPWAKLEKGNRVAPKASK
jgi:hypothetical protein